MRRACYYSNTKTKNRPCWAVAVVWLPFLAVWRGRRPPGFRALCRPHDALLTVREVCGKLRRSPSCWYNYIIEQSKTDAGHDPSVGRFLCGVFGFDLRIFYKPSRQSSARKIPGPALFRPEKSSRCAIDTFTFYYLLVASDSTQDRWRSPEKLGSALMPPEKT